MSCYSPNISVMVAVAVPDIGPLVSLVGSVGFSLLGLIVPVIMETVWYWSDEDEDDVQEQDCWDGTTVTASATTVTTSEKTVTDPGTTTEVDDGPATTAVVAAGGGERRLSSRDGGYRRAIRHLKNLILLCSVCWRWSVEHSTTSATSWPGLLETARQHLPSDGRGRLPRTI